MRPARVTRLTWSQERQLRDAAFARQLRRANPRWYDVRDGFVLAVVALGSAAFVAIQLALVP